MPSYFKSSSTRMGVVPHSAASAAMRWSSASGTTASVAAACPCSAPRVRDQALDRSCSQSLAGCNCAAPFATAPPSRVVASRRAWRSLLEAATCGSLRPVAAFWGWRMAKEPAAGARLSAELRQLPIGL